MLTMAYLSAEKKLDLAKIHIGPEGELDFQSIRTTEESLEDEEFHALVVENESDLIHLKERYPYCPVYPRSLIFESAQQFGNSSWENIYSSYLSLNETWILKNNISLASEIFELTHHLKKLLHQDRMTFFEELWAILKKNLGAKSLKIIFNDLDKNQKDENQKESSSSTSSSKDKLIQSCIQGQLRPTPIRGGEMEETLMDHYKRHFNENLELLEFSPELGRLVLTAVVNSGPVLIIAKAHIFNQLQKALLTSLFTGINFIERK